MEQPRSKSSYFESKNVTCRALVVWQSGFDLNMLMINNFVWLLA